MKVLRRVDTLRRSYGQNSWRCGAILPSFEQDLSKRYPQRAQTSFASSPPLFDCRSFSTASGSDELRTAVDTSTAMTVPHVLEVASSEARLVISKAPKSAAASSSKSTTTPSPQSAQEAMDASKAMMALTSNTKLLAEAVLENKANAEQVASLHQALIAVTSWCTSLVPTNTFLLQNALDLARRAHELSLPLHLPLYKLLVSAIAQYSDEDTKVLTILEIANMAVSALHISLQPSFFSDALIELVKNGEIKNAIVLKKSIEARFDVDHFDMDVLLDLMQALREHVEAQSTDDGAPDVQELLEMIRTPIDVEIKNIKQSMMRDSLADMLAEDVDEEALTDALHQLDEFESSDDDDSDDDDDNDESIVLDDGDLDDLKCQIEAMGESIAAKERQIEEKERQITAAGDLLKSFEAMKQDVSESVQEEESQEDEASQEDALFETDDMIRQRVKELLRPFDDDDESDTDDDDDYETDEMTKQMVYLRDSSSWMLPDVTLQLVEQNGGRDVLYTRAYEEDVLRSVIDTNGTYY